MDTRMVTIAGPDHRVDLAVPADTPVAELLPTFVELTVEQPAGKAGRQPTWGVGPAGKNPLPSDRTLSECGISDGHVLVLSDLRLAAQDPPPKPSSSTRRVTPRHGSPHDRTVSVMPEYLSGPQRLSAAVKAFFDDDEETVPEDDGSTGLIEVGEHRAELKPPGQRSPMQRARASWRDSEYLGRLDRLIVRPRLLRCATIAVVSPKGGVGKTTITALLGSLLAQARRDRVVAVDANPDYGSLGPALAPDHEVFLDDLPEKLEDPNLTVTQLDANLGRSQDGLMVLPAPTDPERLTQLDEATYTKVIRRLQDLVGMLVLDCGTGLQEPALVTADQVIVVSDAQPATAALVAGTAEFLRELEMPVTLVINKMPPARNAPIDVDAFAESIGDVRAVIVVEDDERAAARVAAGEFTWHGAPPHWRLSIRALAVALLADWPTLGLSD